MQICKASLPVELDSIEAWRNTHRAHTEMLSTNSIQCQIVVNKDSDGFIFVDSPLNAELRSLKKKNFL